MYTEKEAWQALAYAWADVTSANSYCARVGGFSCMGLCTSIRVFRDSGLINLTMYESMLAKFKELPDTAGGYKWPAITREGAAARSTFCQRQVYLLEDSNSCLVPTTNAIAEAGRSSSDAAAPS